jgi:hypothetical protein
MSTDRRSFLERLTLGAVGFGALGPFDSLRPSSTPFDPLRPSADWDLTWTSRVSGKRRAVYDVPEIESGYGVWRAITARRQYVEVLKLAPADVSMVLVLRHNAIALAMNQAFWEKYSLGTDKKVTDPVTEQPTTHNPVAERTGDFSLPAEMSGMALEPFLASGGIVLGCALAFQDMIGKVAAGNKVDNAEAERRAKSALVPGVILQPSGVFAAQLAQDTGCRYVRAS